MNEVAEKGRPRSGAFPHMRSLRFGDRDIERLRKLAEKLELAEADIIRMAIRQFAVREGVE